MLNATPFEVIAAPFTLWVAVVGTAFPLVSAVPAVAWVEVGSSGPLNYDDAGVTIEQPQSIAFWKSLGDAGSRKAFRSSEDLKIGLTLVDLTLEQYALALNHNAITTVAAASAIPGTKKIGLSRGFSVDTRALLVRGPSPYMADGIAQFEVPRAAQTGSPSTVFKRDTPAGLKLEWTAMVDPGAATPDEYFGRLVCETAAALP
jgi:hypothetical protein